MFIEMNTNRDASQHTKYIRAKALATYNQSIKDNINRGNAVLAPWGSSDTSASIITEIVVGQTK